MNGSTIEPRPVTGQPAFDVTSVGEALLRLSSPRGEPLEATHSLSAHVGGAEANVLSALAALGRRTSWHSRLPENALGRSVVRTLRSAGVDTHSVQWDRSGGRLGLYFYEPPRGPKPGVVLYDRAGSAFTGFDPASMDWDRLLDTRILHLTGITPALGPACRRITEEALTRAREAGVRTSFDVNYRARLWPASEARSVLMPLLREVDLLICGITDAREVLGLDGAPAAVLDGLVEARGGRDVVLTCGQEGALASVQGDRLHVAAQRVTVVDEIGAGDAFSAGLIDGWLDGSLEEGLHRGTVLAAVKLGTRGDMVSVSRSELSGLMAGATARPVQR